MGYLESLKEIKQGRQQRDTDAQELYALQMKYIALERLKQQTSTSFNQTHQVESKYDAELKELKDRIEKWSSVKKENTRAVNGLIANLYEQVQPQVLIEEWFDNNPITLLPVRIETKYKQTDKGIILMVRVYPDDISVIAHEKTLTEQEIEFGHEHWKILFKNTGSAEGKRNAWKLLVDKFGTNRAAWVAKETIPLNWAERQNLTDTDQLNFDLSKTSKPDSWTKAAHSNVLPDRFVLMGYRNDEEVLSQIGRPIKDLVIVGPEPIVDKNDPSFTRNELDNSIQYGEEYAWIADFNLAVKEGLGFIVPQTEIDAARGYDQLLVLGLKLSVDENEGQQLLENLIENHRYGMEGMSLLRQGTPTNNTESEDAGYQSQQSLDDMALEIETGQQLFVPTNTANQASDGQRLAEYLGVEYSVFQTVQNSHICDHSEAIAMNTALHPGTLGYFTSTMLNGVFSDADRDILRRHFIDYVSGRGPLPAIRVGNQPYGIIVTSDFNNWNYKSQRSDYLMANRPFFHEQLYKILSYMSGKWNQKVAGLTQITKNDNAGETLLKILGLNPGSVEFFQRTGYSYDHLKNQESFLSGGKYFKDTMMMMIEAYQVTQLLTSLGYSNKNDDGSIKTPPMLLELIFKHSPQPLDKNNIVDTEPLSEQTTIKPYEKDGDQNYIDWLLTNMANESKLESQDFGEGKMPKTLLFMMLKNGLLLETNHSIFKYLGTKNIQASELIRSRKFMNISTAPSVSPWEIYKAPVNRLVTNETSTKTLFNHIHTAVLDAEVTINLTENKWALNVLKDMPTARLQRAFTEHLDVLSYRLDAWKTSLFDQRISNHRNLSSGIEDRKKGVYLGSYGYLENVKMRNTRKKVDEAGLPEGLREQKDNLFVENENGGFVHAPSINHATAAAILRNGYLTHANKLDPEALSVNLSSERVRRAKAILEGIRNGQTLEALLGYQFERGMHEWSTRKVNPIILNQLKPDLRKAFPIKKTKVPQEGKISGPEEITEEFSVINGLELAGTDHPYPYNKTGLPALNADQLTAIEQEKNQLKNTLDAVKDLMTAESAYQMASGNFDRAAAVMQSVSNGNIPPEVEVINTARSTQMTFTNRITLHFDATETRSPWSTPIELSPKALTEPALNYWIGSLLGAPENILCLINILDDKGTIILKPNGEALTFQVTLADLKLQPLDFVLLIRNKLETTGASELESRIRYFFLNQQNLDDGIIIKIQFAETGDAANLMKKSFAEILPFANYIRQLIGNGRPLHAQDFISTSDEVIVAADNPNNINWIELKNRAIQLSANLTLVNQQFQDAITALEATVNGSTVTNLRTALKTLADYGFSFAFPNSETNKDQQSAARLLEQSKSTQSRIAEIIQSCEQQMVKVNAAGLSIDQKSSLLIKLIKTILGDNFVVIPKFSFNNPAELLLASSSGNELLSYATRSKDPALGANAGLGMSLPVSEFLHSASLVREKMHTLEMVRLLHQNFNEQDLQPRPMQLPYKNADSWLAVEFPKNTELARDTIAYVQYIPQGFDANKEQCGLLLDEWTETIPNNEEVTGITFNYNQPNSTPPQAILLAVTPNETGNWSWNELTNTVLNTFKRAKERAIEPDDVDKMMNLTSLLPATMAEFSANPFTNISLDYSLNISHKFLEVINIESKKPTS